MNFKNKKFACNHSQEFDKSESEVAKLNSVYIFILKGNNCFAML